MKVQFDVEELQTMAHVVIDRLAEIEGLSRADKAALKRWRAEEVRPASPAFQLLAERLNEEIQRTHESSEVRRLMRPDWV